MSEVGAEGFDQQDFLKLLRDHFGIPADTLEPHVKLVDLGWDSLALLEMIVIVEETTGLKLQERLENQVTAQTTVQDAGAMVSAAIAAASTDMSAV